MATVHDIRTARKFPIRHYAFLGETAGVSHPRDGRLRVPPRRRSLRASRCVQQPAARAARRVDLADEQRDTDDERLLVRLAALLARYPAAPCGGKGAGSERAGRGGEGGDADLRHARADEGEYQGPRVLSVEEKFRRLLLPEPPSREVTRRGAARSPTKETTMEHSTPLTPDDWIAEIDAPDLPLAITRQGYHAAGTGAPNAAWLCSMRRAMWRVCWPVIAPRPSSPTS